MYYYNNDAGPSIVCIGGGTGMSTMLRGLKKLTKNITAIVTVMDDGGGSGVLRDELGMLPPGDIRNCLQALANIEPTMSKLLSYRFDSGNLKGQSFGNLFLAAMNGISSSFDEAVSKMGDVLAITGRVLPVTNEDVWLHAFFEDGTDVFGESHICDEKKKRNCRIRRVALVPKDPSPLKASVHAIKNADLIILGPGSLYTSIIPNLLVSGISEAIADSKAPKLYICNMMTQPGETEDYTVSDHIAALLGHSGRRILDMCLVNSDAVPQDILQRYIDDGAGEIVHDYDKVNEMGIELIVAPLAGKTKNFFRHDPDVLAREIMRIYETHKKNT